MEVGFLFFFLNSHFSILENLFCGEGEKELFPRGRRCHGAHHRRRCLRWERGLGCFVQYSTVGTGKMVICISVGSGRRRRSVSDVVLREAVVPFVSVRLFSCDLSRAFGWGLSLDEKA